MTSIISPSMSDITIRQATVDDAAPLRELRLEALALHPEAFAADFEMTKAEGIEVWSDRLAGHASDKSGAVCIAISEANLIGMSGIGRGHWPKTSHFAKIWGVYVKAEWRGRRIGEQLIDECNRWGRENGVKIVTLGVNLTITAAIRCYARCGFTVYGVEPKVIYYNGNYFDELLMVREL